MQPSVPPSRSLLAWEWSQAILLGAVTVTTTLDLGGYRPVSLPLFYSLLLALAVVHGIGWALKAAAAGWRVHPASWWGCPFLIYAALNVLWISPAPWLGKLDWLLWLAAWLVFWVALNGLRSRAPRAALYLMLLALALLGVLLGAYQIFVDRHWLPHGLQQIPQFHGRASGFFGIPNSLAALILLLFPPTLAAALYREQSLQWRILWGYFAGVMLVGMGLTLSRGGALSLWLALAAWGLWRALRAHRQRWSRSLAVLCILACVGGVAVGLLPQLRSRFDAIVRDRGETSRAILWRAAYLQWREQPAFGGGGASFSTRFEAYRPWSFQDDPQWPHNEVLNLLADYGAVGLGLGLLGVWGAWFASRSERRLGEGSVAHAPSQLGSEPRPPVISRIRFGRGSVLDAALVREGLWIGVVAFALQSNVEFSMKLPALAVIAAMVFAEALGNRPAHAITDVTAIESDRKYESLKVLMVMSLAGFAIAFGLPLLRSESLRYQARRSMDRLAIREEESSSARMETLSQARLALERACELAPENGAAWSDLSYAISLLVREAPIRLPELGSRMEWAAKTALEKAPLVAEHWVRLSVALDAQGQWIDGGRAILRAMELAPQSLFVTYYYAYHLSLNAYTRENALAVAIRCVQLDPSHRPSRRLLAELEARGVKH